MNDCKNCSEKSDFKVITCKTCSMKLDISYIGKRCPRCNSVIIGFTCEDCKKHKS